MSVLRNVNYMKRFVHHACATPSPVVLIETAFEAAAPVLIELFSFQIVQLAMRVPKLIGAQKAPGLPVRREGPDGPWGPRPPIPDRKPGRRPKHGTGLAGGGARARKSFGERLGPNTFIFHMADLEQTGLYWWMIADLATEFQARWTTLIYVHEKCPFDHQCYKQGEFLVLYADRGVHGALLPPLSAGSIFCGGTLIQVRTKPGTDLQREDFTISFEGTLYRNPSTLGPPSGARLELRDAQSGEVLAKGGSNSKPGPDNGRKSGGFYTRPRNTKAHSYFIALVNDTDETVGCPSGTIRIAGGFCVTAAPAIPFDTSHLAGRVSPRPRIPA